MKVTRRFSKPGQDVFSTVEWDRRTSRISNPDGSVVFEMTDAEIPKQWAGFGKLHEPFRLGTRDERPGVHLERQAVELLEAAQVGDGLALGAPRQVSPVAPQRIRADRRLGMGQHDRPTDTDRVPQQQLGVEPRRLRARGPQTVGALRQQRAGRVARRAAGASGPVSRRRRSPRAGRPGRP